MLMANAPSPMAATTRRSGCTSLAAIAPGSENAIVARPLEIRQVLGRYVGYSRAIHIFTAPVSHSTMSSSPSACADVGTMRAGANGNASSAAPRSSSSRTRSRTGGICPRMSWM